MVLGRRDGSKADAQGREIVDSNFEVQVIVKAGKVPRRADHVSVKGRKILEVFRSVVVERGQRQEMASESSWRGGQGWVLQRAYHVRQV